MSYAQMADGYWLCSGCSGIVKDPDAHEDWHRELAGHHHVEHNMVGYITGPSDLS